METPPVSPGMAAKPVLLVVEDDQLILLHATMTLEDEGYEVIGVSDAATALKTAAARPDIAALFTDIDLPGEHCGLDLAAALRRVRPDMRMVITSGTREVCDSDLPEGGIFVPKPYTTADMRRALQPVF
ncbi:DNA-binding NtrC family response regulator [Sphingomonas sp. SORGH_AS802]|uniref:response regulator n=1 Tax=unclassified Sphingomonas TaxID=196159 RepID=UPI0028648D0E|nr:MULTISPECIES: response regulator [unclassified Sphingomonas]MDR6125487.1 DNA-binding NtrC family response regulator [Sphingomonas sp. SORGH_AS_0438]MDR6134103.1 DNA-binding NtrC family response regulator [Sphingomonas sp. SORGH_AS_0802]